MKARENLYLPVEAVARGERLAKGSQSSLSEVVEKQLLQIPEVPGGKEEFWTGPALRPLRRKHDPRGDYRVASANMRNRLGGCC
jgi:hypothetical protein